MSSSSSSSSLKQQTSLVKYDNPILVSSTRDQQSKAKKTETKKHATPTEDILNSILPPREWTADGSLWVQYVSSTPATRSDVIDLQEQLDQRLNGRQARETGICPIREELYAQCFDELIRQVTINCEERGLLLLRVRDEIRTTIASYQTLYESSIAFGMRKALQAEEQKIKLTEEVNARKTDMSSLQKQIQETRQKIDDIIASDEKRRIDDGAKFKEEVDKQKKQNHQLKKELEQLLTMSAPVSSSSSLSSSSKPSSS
eukprot:TRINITY_DN1156_c0_g1_i1.p1 TRINITY_DN1156_c0_g1~~TRINITY_DN1156_c0_g1_i1.p1  ORF type:complete len:258 (-),score=106.01 TRINITY_DN1156_c0_g1_i1:1575-2348(-)